MKRSIGHHFAPILVSLSIQLAAVQAAVVYDNTSVDLAFNLNPGTQEVGDEIMLDGTARWLTEFSFEYWGTSASSTDFTGNVEGRIRFYLNDGPAIVGVDGANQPGTVIFDSGGFAIDPSSRASVTFNDFVTGAAIALHDELPSSFTWSIQFSGMDVNDAAGVTVYSPPSIGNSFDDYWVRDNGSWTLQTNVVAMDFAATFSAVPEPSAVLLGLCGFVFVAVASKKFKR